MKGETHEASEPGHPEESTPAQTTLDGTTPLAFGRANLSREQWEIIDICVRLSRLFSIPKSVGEIFGFVFSMPTPVTFEDVVAALGISNGSASHGLRFLRQVGALKLTYVARDRRDFYVAETSAQRLLAGFLSEYVLHDASDSRQRLAHLHAQLNLRNDLHATDLLPRVELLMDWSKQGSTAMQAAMSLFV